MKMSPEFGSIAFPTSCPPDVPCKSRVVAVCGATEFEDAASPTKDGWLFSDFYLFHKLLSVVESSNQVWLTSEDPADLVAKYREYAHGDSKQDRRVVLNEDLLEGVQQAGNVKVVERSALLEHFNRTITEQASIAATSGEHLIILLVGYGELESFGVAVGGDCIQGKAPKLTMEHIKPVLQHHAPVTLFMTSCYSSGWLVQTSAEGKLPLNASVGHANGSIVARAILASIMTSKELEMRSSFRDESPYISLAHSILDAHTKHNPRFDEHQIQFSTQNDWWANNYQPRIGIALERFKELWESLPSSPRNEDVDDASTAARKRRHVHYHGWRYMSSYPGPHNSAKNLALHGQLMWLTNKKSEFSDIEIDRLYRTLQYRLAILEHVDELVKVMGLQMPSIADFETRGWKGSKEEEELYSKAWDLVLRGHLLHEPLDAGHSYHKPVGFLSIALASSKLTLEEITERVEMAKRHVLQRSDQIYFVHGGDSIMNDEEVVRHRNAFFPAMRELGYRVEPRVPNQGVRVDR